MAQTRVSCARRLPPRGAHAGRRRAPCAHRKAARSDRRKASVRLAWAPWRAAAAMPNPAGEPCGRVGRHRRGRGAGMTLPAGGRRPCAAGDGARPTVGERAGAAAAHCGWRHAPSIDPSREGTSGDSRRRDVAGSPCRSGVSCGREPDACPQSMSPSTGASRLTGVRLPSTAPDPSRRRLRHA